MRESTACAFCASLKVKVWQDHAGWWRFHCPVCDLSMTSSGSRTQAVEDWHRQFDEPCHEARIAIERAARM